MKLKPIIKISQHSLDYSNSGKESDVQRFLNEYNETVWWFVDYLWDNKIEYLVGGKLRVMDIRNNKLNVPNYISTISIPYQSDLSARAIKLASGEALSIIKSRVEKRRKQLWVLSSKMKEGADVKRLQSAIDSNPLTKPSKSGAKVAVRLDSNCCTFVPNKTREFDGFLKLHALGKQYNHIFIPIKLTRHTRNLIKKGYVQMTSWTITQTTVNSIWKKEPPKSNGTNIVGADQGLLTCLTLSDGQITPKCPHGHDLNSIINKMSRKKKGSNGFRRAQTHRKNYTDWSIKQLDLSNIKELRLEQLHDVRRGKGSSRSLGHWTYTAINTQIKSRCSELGVLVVEQPSMYRSQRCSSCGWTQKSNRKGKEFRCKKCGFVHDSDLNGALNHEADLYPLPFGFRQAHLSHNGFYWLGSGVTSKSGQELIVPDV